ITPYCSHKLVPALLESRFGQVRLATAGDHVEGTGAGALGVVSQEKRVRQERISRQRGVRMAELVCGQAGRQFAWVPNFKTVGEKHDLHGGVRGVVAVGDSVDDGFSDDLFWNLISHRHSDTL